MKTIDVLVKNHLQYLEDSIAIITAEVKKLKGRKKRIDNDIKLLNKKLKIAETQKLELDGSDTDS